MTDAKAKAINTAAIRHLVFTELWDCFPYISCEQFDRVVFNLRIGQSELRGVTDERRRQRLFSKATNRLLMLKVTPDICETPTLPGWCEGGWPKSGNPPGKFVRASLETIERRMNERFGDYLKYVPGFYRRNESAPFRLNLPRNCALYGYGNMYGPSQLVPQFYNGILCQPLDRRDSFFLLSSAKYGGPKAPKLSPADALFFSQYEECAA